MSKTANSRIRLLFGLLFVVLIANCASENRSQTETAFVPPSTLHAEQAIREVQAQAPFPACSDEVTDRTVPASAFVETKVDRVSISCPVEDGAANIIWSAINDIFDRNIWTVSFGGYDQSQISHLWSPADRVAVQRQLGSVSLAYWIWRWNRMSGEVTLIRVDWPAAGYSVCGVQPPC